MSCHLLCSGTLPASYSCVCVASLGTRLSTVRHMNINSVQSLGRVRLSATLWTAARQASLSITNSQSLLKLMSVVSVMHSTISSSVVPFSSRLQSCPASGICRLVLSDMKDL